MGKWDALVKGALLHDIGKVVYRANQGTDAHSKRGAAFIEPYFSDMGLKANYYSLFEVSSRERA